MNTTAFRALVDANLNLKIGELWKIESQWAKPTVAGNAIRPVDVVV